MAIKAKTKSTRAVKKTSFVSAPEIKTLSIFSNRLNSSVLLKNKKLSIGIGITATIVVLVLLAILFKNIFVAALVNGEPISRLSVVIALEKQGGKTTLDNLITKKLILQEAKKRHIAVTQNDIDSEIKKITTNLQTQGSTLDQALASRGMTKFDLNDEIRVQVAINKIIGADVTVTEKEINDFVTTNKGQMTEGITEAQFREQATGELKQQKLQTKIQELIKNLRDKAKVLRLVSY